jgi:hypothetical protein
MQGHKSRVDPTVQSTLLAVIFLDLGNTVTLRDGTNVPF